MFQLTLDACGSWLGLPAKVKRTFGQDGCYRGRKRQASYLHLSMSPLGDQREESEAANRQVGQAVMHRRQCQLQPAWVRHASVMMTSLLFFCHTAGCNRGAARTIPVLHGNTSSAHRLCELIWKKLLRGSSLE